MGSDKREQSEQEAAKKRRRANRRSMAILSAFLPTLLIGSFALGHYWSEQGWWWMFSREEKESTQLAEHKDEIARLERKIARLEKGGARLPRKPVALLPPGSGDNGEGRLLVDLNVGGPAQDLEPVGVEPNVWTARYRLNDKWTKRPDWKLAEKRGEAIRLSCPAEHSISKSGAVWVHPLSIEGDFAATIKCFYVPGEGKAHVGLRRPGTDELLHIPLPERQYCNIVLSRRAGKAAATLNGEAVPVHGKPDLPGHLNFHVPKGGTLTIHTLDLRVGHAP